MLSTYLETAWCTIVRGKLYSLLNLPGLATGMAVALLIGLWLYYRLSYDRSVPGYFGLAAYRAEQRTREIGIRKALGASVSQVLLLLSGDFILLVGYYYRITISPLVFVVAAVLALAITVITVGLQSVRSPMENPVTALRSE